MGFTDSSIVQKIALAVFPVALLLQIIGLASPYWIYYSKQSNGIQVEFNFGLWRFCATAIGCRDFSYIGDLEDWYKAVRALEILGLLVIAVAIVSTALSIFMSSESTQKIGKILAVVSAFVAAGFILIGVIVFASKLESEFEQSMGALGLATHLSWAFGLCIVAAIMSVAGGILISLNLGMLVK